MSRPTLTAWDNHQPTVDETEFTPWATEGTWLAWNGQSPEVEVCLFVASMVMMMRPKLVIETGVGQGYMTRSIVPMLNEGQHLIAFESNDRWREELWNLTFWRENGLVTGLSPHNTPSPHELGAADLCVFDSDWEFRFEEVRGWHTYAKTGAVCLIHDTSDQPQTIHETLRSLIRELGMTGVFLKNPRGCFMAIQGER